MQVRDIIFVSVFLLIAVLAVIGNMVVILAVFSHRRLRNPANYLIANLAISDFLQGAVSIPLRIAETLNTSDEKFAVRCDVVIGFSILFFGASNVNLALIALDRFVAISKPLSYPGVMKTSSYKIVIAVTWILVFLLSFSPVFGWRRGIDDPSNENPAGSVCRFGTTLTDEYLIIFVILIDFIPLVIMLVTYTYIFRTTRKQIRQIRAHEVAVTNAAINLAFEYRPSRESNRDASVSAIRGDVDEVATDEGVKPTTQHCDKNGTVLVTKNNNNNNNVDEVVCSVAKPQAAVSTAAATSTRNTRNVPLSTVRTRKATRTVLAIIGFFFLLCLPITIIDVIDICCHSCGPIPIWITTVALWMVSMNCCVNVFVYGGYNTDYRKAYRNVWSCARKGFYRNSPTTIQRT